MHPTPENAMREALTNVRPLAEWHEDIGDVLWWTFPIEEPLYVGSPLDVGQTVEVTVRAYNVDKLVRCQVGGWPGYHTHWTPISTPIESSALASPPSPPATADDERDTFLGRCPHCLDNTYEGDDCPYYKHRDCLQGNAARARKATEATADDERARPRGSQIAQLGPLR